MIIFTTSSNNGSGHAAAIGFELLEDGTFLMTSAGTAYNFEVAGPAPLSSERASMVYDALNFSGLEMV